MSAPALSRRPRPEGGLPVDEEELSRFQAWLVGRGYADRTATTWASRIRRAYALGVGSPDDVDTVLWCHMNPSRTGLRQALENLEAFRRAGR